MKKYSAGEVLENGVMLDVIREKNKYKFLVRKPNGERSTMDMYEDEDIQYIPMDLAAAGITTVISSSYEEEVTPVDLKKRITQYILKYVDVIDDQADVMARYVLITWVKDIFPFIPMLRLQGSPGSGKSTTLKVFASICYKSCIFGGAVTPATLFRKQEQIRGTLLVDEFNKPDTSFTTDFAQIFNAGCNRDAVILRCNPRTYTPEDFHVGGPKIVASRNFFDDGATETRFITINLLPTNKTDLAYAGDAVKIDAQSLVTSLMGFRHQNLNSINPGVKISGLECYNRRFQDVFSPLFQVLGQNNIGGLEEFIKEAYETLDENLYLSDDKCVAMAALIGLEDKNAISCIEISSNVKALYGLNVHPRRIGGILRSNGFKPDKRSYANVITNSPINIEKLKRIAGDRDN